MPCKPLKPLFERLKLDFGVPEYYRDMKLWLPDVQWGRESMPNCPTCGENRHVGAHGFRDNRVARRIIGLEDHYYMMSRRYICHHCETQRKYAARAIAD